MNEIKCPHCGKTFQVDESDYHVLVEQVRTEEFAKEIEQQKAALRATFEQEKKAALAEGNAAHEKQLHELMEKLQKLEAELHGAETKKQLALAEAEKQAEIRLAQKLEEERKRLAALEMEKSKLETALQVADQQKADALARVSAEAKTQLLEMKSEVDKIQMQAKLERESLLEQHKKEIAIKDEQIEQYRNFKLSLGTKMVGEDLEQYCLTKYNETWRTVNSTAYFEKDNDASGGSKGDFIYRETDENGVEIISIMFEMKNEAMGSTNHHKNEEFFDKLNRDRIAKKCEYAVLVSMLEPENDYYNAGIVDVSYRHEKMYVVRPQCFIPIISILRNAAVNNLKARYELAQLQREQLDVTHFEERLNGFKDLVGRSYELATKQYEKSIAEIDKAIKHLEDTREALQTTIKHLTTANKHAQGITIRKLTNDNPTMKKRLDEAREAAEKVVSVESGEEE